MNTDWIYLDKTMQKDRVINDSTKKPESIYGINISNGNYEYLSENDFNNLVIFHLHKRHMNGFTLYKREKIL